MASELHKKWILIALFIIVSSIVVSVLISRHNESEKLPEVSSEKIPASGPVADLPAPQTGVPAGRTGSNMQQQVVSLDQLGVDIKNPALLAKLGDAYFENKNFEQAVLIYDRVLQLNPEDVDTYNDKGLALHYAGKSDLAVQTLKKGSQIDPSYQRIWLSLGYVLVVSEKQEEAKAPLKKAAEMNPSTSIGKEAQKILELLE